MVNIELRLFAKMLQTGNFGPIIRGEIAQQTMTTQQGAILFDFVTTYRTATDGVARFPSLSIVRSRFVNSGIELPDPDPGDSLEALVYETQTQHIKARAQDIAIELDTLAKSSDGLLEGLTKNVNALRKLTDRLHVAKHTSLATGIEDIIADYDLGAIMPEGIPWPWDSMTRPTKGMQRGDFIIVAGRPKSRKTFTALSIAAHAMVHHHARVLIFSPEMKRRMVLLRVIAFVCGLRYAELKDTQLSELEIMNLTEAARRYGRMPDEDDDQYGFRLHTTIPDLPPGACPSIDIVESTGRSLSWMEAQIELYQPDIVVADSAYRQPPDGQKKNDTDHKIMTALSRGLKDMAMSQNVVLLATHQLNREAESKVGSLSNLGYSDAFGMDLDLGLRVITGKIEGRDVSALVVLGGRELPFEGILINNVPCCDFSEIGPIVNRKTVANLLAQEDEAEAKEEAEEVRRKATDFKTKTAPQLKRAAEAVQNRMARLGKGLPEISEGEESG